VDEQRDHFVLKVDDPVVHVDAYWLWRYAGDFLAAAEAFTLPESRFSPVSYYLLGHSIELSLKAFLFPAGFKSSDRKNLNHDLERALSLAEKHDLGAYVELTSDDRDVIHKTNRLYASKEFEYFERLDTVYNPPDFELDALASLARRLFEAIEDPVRVSVIE